MVKIITGNIFSTECQTLVNTVNCVGVMGAGIALEHRLRYPQMYERYVELCMKKQIQIGNLWLYKDDGGKWVLNFPTKNHWRFETKEEYLEKGLQKFIETYKEKSITSIAFPLLGASHGGLSENTSLRIMQKYLSQCDIPVEIYKYDPKAEDDLYKKFRDTFISIDALEIRAQSGIDSGKIKKIIEVFENHNIRSLSRLATVKGIGEKTLEKAFRFAMDKPSFNLKLDL